MPVGALPAGSSERLLGGAGALVGLTGRNLGTAVGKFLAGREVGIR